MLWCNFRLGEIFVTNAKNTEFKSFHDYSILSGEPQSARTFLQTTHQSEGWWWHSRGEYSDSRRQPTTPAGSAPSPPPTHQSEDWWWHSRGEYSDSRRQPITPAGSDSPYIRDLAVIVQVRQNYCVTAENCRSDCRAALARRWHGPYWDSGCPSWWSLD